MKKILFLDIDETLLKPDSKLAVIDKNEPQTIIYRIDYDKIPLMKTYWKKYNLEVKYNGETYYLSPEMFELIKRGKKDITIDRIGISNREWTNDEFLDVNKDTTEFLINKFMFLRGQKDLTVALLTAREAKDQHIEFIKKIKSEIADKLKLTVSKEYFVNNFDSNHNSDVSAWRKGRILLEHLIGYKIKMNKFSNIEHETFDEVDFYDDDSKNIDVANKLQDMFEEILKHSSDKVKENVYKKFENRTLNFNTYLSTSNDVNPFIEKKHVLVLPRIKESAVFKFNTFIIK